MTLSAFTRSVAGLASLSAALVAFAGPAAAQVKTEALAALDLWSAPGRDTGLAPDLWRGASPELTAGSLSALDPRPSSLAGADLARRLLATGAAAPDGAGADTDLAAARARTLTGLGDPASVAAMLAHTPKGEASAALSRARSEADLLMGRHAEACDTGKALQVERDTPWQIELRALCSFEDGQAGAAQVALDLWRQGGGKDPAFDRLMTAALAETPARASLSSPLTWALSRKQGLDLGPALSEASPAMLWVLALEAATPPAVRLEATVRALRLGLADPASARALYDPPAGPDAAVTDGPAPPTLQALTPDPSATAEAALYRMAAHNPDPVVRQKALVLLLGRAHGPGEFIALSRLARPALAETVALGPTLDDSLEFALAAAISGDEATAASIRTGMDAGRSPGAAPLDTALVDAVRALASRGATAPVLDRLAQSAAAGDAGSRGRAQGAMLILAALGEPLSGSARAQLAEATTAPAKASGGRLQVLALDARAGLKGETGLLAAAILQAPGADASDRAAVIEALATVGFDQDARAVAIEGLVALARGR